MKKRLLTLLTLSSLCFIGCNHDKTKKIDKEGLNNISVEIKHITSTKHPLLIEMDINNHTNQTIHFSDYIFPYKSGTLGRNYFTIIEDGKQLSYIGPKIKRVPQEIQLKSGEKYYINNIELSKNYNLTKGTHRYEITSIFGLKKHTSNTLEFDATIK